MLLITQSLLSAWGRTFDCYEGTEEEARASFLRTLRRQPSEPNDAMRKGLQFEAAVYAAMAGAYEDTHPAWESGIRAVATRLTGCQTQVRAYREIKVDGRCYLIYGVLDALKAGVIYDVKFSTRSFGSAELAGKYLNSPQHPAYFCIVPEAFHFEYLVSDGSDLYVESYERSETRHISEFIRPFVRSLEAQGLWDEYESRWSCDRPA